MWESLHEATGDVNHDILLYKLEHYGCRGQALDWFRSYLTGRKQYVYVNKTKSNPIEINHGVPVCHKAQSWAPSSFWSTLTTYQKASQKNKN